jgi:hypothetical protein
VGVQFVDAFCHRAGHDTKRNRTALSLTRENAFGFAHRGASLGVASVQSLGTPGHMFISVPIQHMQA